MAQCCLSGFKWNARPEGTEAKLANNDTYVTGSNKDVAIMVIHDIFGWTFENVRLLADHYAKEADATVYMPDFFGGEVVTLDTMDPEKNTGFDLGAFLGRHSKEVRWPEIEACAKALKRGHGYKKVGALGFCYGGWAVFQLGAKGQGLVDCISTAHPRMLTKEEIDNVAVPVQINAPEHDPLFTPELKAYANEVIPKLGVPYNYQFYPGVAHGFVTKCDESKVEEKKALERAKNAMVSWFAQMLHLH